MDFQMIDAWLDGSNYSIDGHHVSISQMDDASYLYVTLRKGTTSASFRFFTEEAATLGAMLLSTADGDWEPRHD